MKTISNVKGAKFRSGFPGTSSRIEKIIVADNTRMLISTYIIFRRRDGGSEPGMENNATISKTLATK